MRSFSKQYLSNLSLSPATSWLLSLCAEEKGKEEFCSKAKPAILKALRDLAIVQSSESSNRIEGVTVEKDRLLPLINNKVRPKDRSEEEVLGYRKALEWIHKNYERVVIEPKTIQKLHTLSQSGLTGDASKWKKRTMKLSRSYLTVEELFDLSLFLPRKRPPR